MRKDIFVKGAILLAFFVSGITLEAKEKKEKHKSEQKRVKDESEGCPCGPVIQIDSLPFVANKSAIYCINKNLSFNETNNPAITVAVNGVTIEGNGHTIALDPNSVGIVGTNVKNFVLKNLSIISTAPSTNASSTSLFLTGVDHFKIQNIRTTSTFRGIKLVDSTNGQFVGCVQENHATGFDAAGDRSLAFEGTGFCRNLSFDQCQYKNNISDTGSPDFNTTRGFGFLGPNLRDFRFTNCMFYNTDININSFDLSNSLEGLLIDNCEFSIDIPYSHKFLELVANHGVIVQNCTFTNKNADPHFDAITIFSGSNMLFDKCVIDCNASGFAPTTSVPTYPASHFHVGFTLSDVIFAAPPNLLADNITIRNCTLRGGTKNPNSQRAFHAIYVEPFCTGILIENVNASHFNSGTLPAQHFNPNLGGFGNPIKGGAIRIEGRGVVVKNCIVHDVSNGAGGPGDGIVLGGAYTFTGFNSTLDVPETTNCTIQNCNVTKCTGFGIRNDSEPEKNLIVDNLSFHNQRGNYKGVPKESIVDQGDPAVAGQNLR